MQCHKAQFDGDLLKRGFWLYVCVVSKSEDRIFYVGRTGDSSSMHASSPFLRLTRHLDFRYAAKGATMLNQILKHGWKLEECSFELVAFGPLHPEQEELIHHNSCRDTLASLERDVAAALKVRGHVIVGDHRSKAKESPELLAEILTHPDFIW